MGFQDNSSAERAKASKRRGRIVTLDELAEITGHQDRVLRRMINEGMPVHENKGPGAGNGYRFDTAQVIHWFVFRAEEKAKGPEMVTQEEAKTRKLLAQAEMEEIKVARTKGELLPKNETRQLMADVVLKSRARLLVLPNKMAPMVVGIGDVAEIETRLNGQVREALDELSKLG